MKTLIFACLLIIAVFGNLLGGIHGLIIAHKYRETYREIWYKDSFIQMSVGMLLNVVFLIWTLANLEKIL